MKYRGMFTFILSVHTEYPYCGVNYEGNGVFYWPFAVLKDGRGDWGDWGDRGNQGDRVTEVTGMIGVSGVIAVIA